MLKKKLNRKKPRVHDGETLILRETKGLNPQCPGLPSGCLRVPLREETGLPAPAVDEDAEAGDDAAVKDD